MITDMDKETQLTEEFHMEQMEQETEEMLRLRYLNRENAVFRRTRGGFVSLTVQEEQYPRISVYRTFPFTDCNKYISVREPDEKAKEIGIIKDLDRDVDRETAAMLTEQMNLRYFTPVIESIIDIKDEYGYAYFDVRTDHGSCRFTVRMGGDGVTHLTDTRLLIQDLDGNRFEVPDIRKLSAKELKKLDLFL